MIFIFNLFNDVLFKFQTTPLIIAIQQSNKEAVKILLENPKIDVNVKIIFKK